MTTPDNPVVRDITTRLEFSLSSDALDFQKTGKGVLVVEDGQANLPLPTGPRGPVGHLTKDDKAFLDDRSDAAASSAAAAKTSETNAKSSETKAKTSETNAKASETKAKASETAAASSASSALSSKSAADSSATAAANSASDALESRNAAGVSRTAAAASAAATKASEDNAKASETAAASSASAASSSQSAAASSASAAKTSETKAKTSETKAKASEEASASSATASAESASAADLAKSGAEGAAGDADLSRQAALEHEQGAKAHREASEAARLGSEKARDLAEDYRDGAKAHREEAGLSRDDAAASATSANTSANTASAKATEISNKIQQALDAVDDVEQIKQDLQDLMADTEAWNSVQSAIEQVDSEIAAAMQQVKDDILGGVGPAFDTLLELAEALGENADAIATITNQLADKSEKGHTHTSADITDAYHYMGEEVYADRIVKTHRNGHIYMRTDPPAPDALARKQYVDDQVATKSNTGHTHTIANVTGLQTALNGKAPTSHIHAIKDVDGLEAQLSAKSADGHKHTSADVTDTVGTIRGEGLLANRVLKTQEDGQLMVDSRGISDRGHVINKAYVDDRLTDGTREGVSLLPMAPGTQIPMWAYSFRQVTDGVPPGEVVAYANNEDGTSRSMEYSNGWVKVVPGMRYRIRYWLKASKPGSDLVLWSRGDNGTHAVENVTVGASPIYPVWIKDLPTEWTHYEATFNIRQGVTAFKISQVNWNHGAGETTDAVQYISGLEIWPDTATRDHKHTSADITDLPSWSAANNSGTLVQRSPASGNFQVSPPSHPQHVTTKEYVDSEVGKKADEGHKHKAWEIENKTPYADAQADANDMVITGNDGFIHSRDNPTVSNHLARKGYVDQEVAKKADADHTHGVADINASGTRGSTTYLRGDGTWVAPPNTTYSVPSQSEAEAGTATTARAFSAQRVRQAVAAYAPSKGALETGLAGKADKTYVDQEVGKKANASHTHAISDVTGLQDAIDDAAGAATWSELDGKPSTFPPSTHTHAFADLTGVPDVATKGYVATEVAKKADKAHTHTAAQVGARPSTWTPTAAQVGAATPAYVDERIQLVTAWPSSPVAGVLYLMEEE